ncbi:putative membrane protein [Colletotrichum siamense]|uniref:Membrane protein n=1 Tax=Colletotrichum siamense TaxID=690259 RepID=A0A9P5K6W3_COLSI|nr:putative membrane protein [Colletotrichum siamense]KAF4861458.1 putative membrane protein [Colletotrichum siamense]
MRLSAVACGLFACFVSQVAATALTYKIHANEKACFYAKTQKENEKVAFYFAVQSGGSFDIDYVVTGPGNKVILDGSKERQGDFVFTAQQIGDYEFCFNNEMSTFAEKFVDFEIAVENEVRAQLPSKQGASQEQHTTLEETIFKLSGQLSTISRGQKYFRTRENRNFSTVRSTESRIINFSMIQCALIVLMGALQVFIVRFFFQGARKGYADRGTTVILLPERRELGELRVSVISLVCDPARSSKRPIAFLTTCDTLCDYARHTWAPPRQSRRANRTPSNTNTTFSEVVRDLSMPSGARRSSKQQRKKPREPNEPKWYTIKNILDQRQYGGTIEYLIDWDDDKKTGERFPPSWAPSKDVTSKAIFDWKKKQEEAYTQYATGSEEPESQREREEEAEDQGASSHSPTVSTPDSSQPIRPPHRRKRLHSERFAEESENSQIEDSEEDEHDLSKRHCSEPPSLLSFSSEFDTDAASDILLEAPSNIFVAIPSKVEFDPTEYLSVSGSQGSTSHGSQPISTQEDEDNQVLLTENLSQRTIPDSQDYSGPDSQESQFAASTIAPITNRGEIISDREIADSQRQSSVGTSLSKTSESQTRLSCAPSGRLSQDVLKQSPLQGSHSEVSQHRQEDPVFSDPVFFTQYFPSQSQHLVIPNTLPSIPESQLPNSESAAPRRSRSASQDSALLAAQAAAQLVQEQESVPASFSDASIPSHQVDSLSGHNDADQSSRSSGARHQESQSSGAPVFLTQPAFDFDSPSSSESSSSQENRTTGTSGGSGQRISQTAYPVDPAQITVSDSQGDSINTQHAQRVVPLPQISASQIGSVSSLTEEEFIPDTVRRKPQQPRLCIDSSLSASDALSHRSVSTTPSGRLLAHLRHNRRRQSLEESFRTCVERRSLPPSNSDSASAPVVGSNRQSSLPAAMASTGEPMSAIEELLKMQEAAMSGDLGDDSGEHLGQLDGNGSVATGPTDTHDFSMAMENPSLQINSQPPISTDWHMGGAATSSSELPVLTSAPVQPAIQAPASEHPPTANPGDIFSGNLMAAETAQQLPMTISPSDISRSIEPDDPLTALHQLDDAPLSILPAEDTATAKSTASSPDVEQYRSGPPTSMDQSEYLVTVSFPANIRPLYLSTITVYKNEIEQFNRLCRSGEALPDETLVSAIGRLLDQLRDICDLPAPLDSGTIDALAAEDLKKHAMGTNSKYFFVGRFLERLQTSHKKVLIVVRDITIMGYLEAIIGTSDIAYSLKGLHELESDDEHSLNVVLMHTEQTLVDDLSDFDVIIGFDGGIMRTDVLSRWAQMNGRKPMLIRLMTTYSVEHLEPMLGDEMSELDRTNALLIAMFQSRGLISNDEQGEMIDGLTAHFANQVIDPEPNFGWEPEPVPTAVLDLYSDSQHQSQMPPTAEELTSRKRKADDGPQEVTKRLRVSPSPGRDGGSIDDTVRGHLNPNPTHVQVRTTQDHLDSLTTKISELEYQLAEKTTLEANLRKHVNSLSKRVKSHDKTINIIQEKHMAALKERSQFEAERDAAKQTEEKALKKSQTWQNKVQKLEEELKKKSATLDEALVDAGTVATEVFKQKTDELEKSLAKIADLEKKLESRDGELSYARDAYQTANHANSELSRENKELKEQVAEFHKQAAGSLAQIQDINSKEQIKEMQRQIAETQAISRDREKELARVEKELRTLKNGRRETRQQSVPRSPRLGMMSPRAPRTAGGSASRGTSPVPYESSGTGSTPVPGMQFLPSNNHRFNHLRE